VGVLAICLIALLFAGYNGTIFGATLPVLLADHRLALGTAYAGLIGTVSVAAMIVGGLAAGMLSDHIGWSRVVAGAVFADVLGASLCAIARTPEGLLLGRLVVGLGLGAFNPPAQAAVVRYSPPARQGFYFGLASSVLITGQVLATVSARLLVPRCGYVPAFWLGAGPVVVLLFLASGTVRVTLRRLLSRRPAAAAGEVEPRLFTAPRRVLGTTHRRATVVFGVGSAMCLLVVYATTTWLPLIMVGAGYVVGSAVVFLMLMKLGTIAGTLVGGWSADRHGYRPVLVLACGCALVGLVMVAASPRLPTSYLMIALVGVGAAGAQNLLIAYAGACYPSAVRATGLSVINVVGLVGGSLGPAIGAVLLSGGASSSQVLLVFAVAPAIAMLVLPFAPAVLPRPAEPPPGVAPPERP
jgi:AAHS family benzoate transporter-like MFS transporter